MTDPTLPQTAAADSSGRKRKLLLPAGLLAGGMALGAAFSPIGLASAQTDDSVDSTESDSTEADTSADSTEAEAGERMGHHRRGGERGADVAEFLGLTTDEIKAGIEADQTLVEIAAAAGTSEADLVAYLTGQASSRIDQHVTDGDLTAEEAAERLAAVEEKIAEGVNTRPSERPERGEGEGRGRGGHGGRGFGDSSVLEDLGITSDALQAGREAGMTLAEIAEGAGVSQDALVDALVAEATERANEAVEAGRLDADEVAERIADLEEKITERVDAEPGEVQQRQGRRGGRGLEGETVESGLDT